MAIYFQAKINTKGDIVYDLMMKATKGIWFYIIDFFTRLDTENAVDRAYIFMEKNELLIDLKLEYYNRLLGVNDSSINQSINKDFLPQCTNGVLYAFIDGAVNCT